MKKSAILFLVLSLALGSYGYWGLFSQSGMEKYDEMDGFIPFFILIGGCILFLVFLILAVILLFKKVKK